MINRHTVAKQIKKLLLGDVETYFFNEKKILFAIGSRPIRRKYISSVNGVVRNDVLQINYFEQNFGPNDILWDVGSHYGHYSLFAASVARGPEQIFSFEPDADARKMQYKNIALNRMQDKIKILDLAVSNIDGQLSFHSQEGNSTSHIVKTSEVQETGIIKVNAKTIDTLLTELPAPTIIKIDAEGAEIDILRQAGRLLRDPAVKFICELHPFAWDSFGVSYSEFESIIKKFDRKLSTIDPQKKITDLPFYGTVLF